MHVPSLVDLFVYVESDQWRSQPYLPEGAKCKNLPDFSSFSWFSPSFSCFFLIFSLFFLIFGNSFAVKGGTLPPLTPPVAIPLNQIFMQLFTGCQKNTPKKFGSPFPQYKFYGIHKNTSRNLGAPSHTRFYSGQKNTLRNFGVTLPLFFFFFFFLTMSSKIQRNL